MKKTSHRFFRAGIVPFLLIFILGGLLPVKPAAAQTPTLLTVDLLTTNMLVGETATIHVRVQDVVDLYGADVQLSFDPDVLEVLDEDSNRPGVQVAHGGWLNPANPIINRVDNTVGTIRYAMTQVNPDPPKSGSGALFTFRVRAKKAALNSPLHFDTKAMFYPLLSAVGGVSIAFTTQDGVVNARQPGDLMVTIDDGVEQIEAGKPITYTITVTNEYEAPVAGAVVANTMPAALEGVTWTCAASAGSSCAASGSGNIADTVTLAGENSVVYTVQAMINAAMAGALSHSVSVQPPPVVQDVHTTDDTSTHTSLVIQPNTEDKFYTYIPLVLK